MNIQNLYVMRAYDITGRKEKINKIDAQLCSFNKAQTIPMIKHLNVNDVRSFYI